MSLCFKCAEPAVVCGDFGHSPDGQSWPTTAGPLMPAGTAEAEILSGLLRQLSH